MSDQQSADQIEAERLYVTKSWTMEAIAQKFSLNRRTIERWADKWDWSAKKRANKANKVVSINQASDRADSEDEPPRRSRRKPGSIDELEIVENAIVSLDLLLSCMGGTSEGGAIDTRGIGATAGALVKLLEYRRKIQPPTVAALADMAIALGVRPNEFMSALAEAWKLRA